MQNIWVSFANTLSESAAQNIKKSIVLCLSKNNVHIAQLNFCETICIALFFKKLQNDLQKKANKGKYKFIKKGDHKDKQRNHQTQEIAKLKAKKNTKLQG